MNLPPATAELDYDAWVKQRIRQAALGSTMQAAGLRPAPAAVTNHNPSPAKPVAPAATKPEPAPAAQDQRKAVSQPKPRGKENSSLKFSLRPRQVKGVLCFRMSLDFCVGMRAAHLDKKRNSSPCDDLCTPPSLYPILLQCQRWGSGHAAPGHAYSNPEHRPRHCLTRRGQGKRTGSSQRPTGGSVIMNPCP